MKLRTKKLSLGIAFGVLLAGAFLIVSNAMNVGLPFFDDESTVSRTKNKSLDKDADSKDDKKATTIRKTKSQAALVILKEFRKLRFVIRRVTASLCSSKLTMMRPNKGTRGTNSTKYQPLQVVVVQS